jgi:hypothetical protein
LKLFEKGLMVLLEVGVETGGVDGIGSTRWFDGTREDSRDDLGEMSGTLFEVSVAVQVFQGLSLRCDSGGLDGSAVALEEENSLIEAGRDPVAVVLADAGELVCVGFYAVRSTFLPLGYGGGKELIAGGEVLIQLVKGLSGSVVGKFGQDGFDNWTKLVRLVVD